MNPDRSAGKKPAEVVQLVAFRVGEGLYAVDILRIKEIINPLKITAVPKAPAFIEGVLELRGAILPIVDLRKRFDLPATPPTRSTKIIIVAIDVGGRRMIVGLIVDGVLEPLRVQRDQIRPAPALATGENPYFSGVVNRRRAERSEPRENDRRKQTDDGDEGIFMLVDLDAILSSKEKITLAGLGDGSGDVTRVLVAHDSESIREVIRRLLEGVGWSVDAVGDGTQAIEALARAPAALVLDVAVGGRLAYEVVEEARKHGSTKVVLIASIYNRTGYKRRPTSLYGADDYVEQHHIPDSLVQKLTRLIGAPPEPTHVPPPHADTPEGRTIRAAGESRLERATPWVDQVHRAERLARLIVADIALYNGEAIDRAARGGSQDELDARLRMDLEEGRLLFEVRVPAEVRKTRDFIAEALEQLKAQRRHEVG